MKAARSNILFFICVILINHAIPQSPPQLLDDYATSQHIVRPGISVSLSCPIRGNKHTIIFEWSKDKESLMIFGGQRLRITSNGALKIKDTTYDDTGVYTCRAVNGFGSVEFNTTLIVIGDDDDYEPGDQYDEMDDINEEQDEPNPRKPSLAMKPRMLYVSESKRTIHKPPGSTLKMQCVAKGRPSPDLVWYKDNSQVSKAFRTGRYSIKFEHLRPSDSGNYTCVASNILGLVSHSFIVAVDDSRMNHPEKPTVWGKEPSNTTVEEGQMAVMQCVVKSYLLPHIQWLKQVDQSQLTESEFESALKMDNEVFRVLVASEIIDREDGTYYNKMVIKETEIEDAGKYVCLVANQFGYNYRSAHLGVRRKKRNLIEGRTVPFPIVVTVTVIAVASFAGIFSLLVYCRRRKSGGSGQVPMVTKETFLPMQQGTSENSRFSSESKRARCKHQSKLYVPSNNINEIF